MEHIAYLNKQNDNSTLLLKKATGRYFTHKMVADDLINNLAKIFENEFKEKTIIKVIDPFAGDGRLIAWLIEFIATNYTNKVNWDITLLDINDAYKSCAKNYFNKLKKDKINIEYKYDIVDSFKKISLYNHFDIVITNPPWELLKPDRRELLTLNDEVKNTYIKQMKIYDNCLSSCFPLSQPKSKFAGWGTNLSRVGLELSMNICKKNSFVAIILPASFLADQQSIKLRKHLIENTTLKNVTFFPAELKLFKGADIDSCSLIIKKNRNQNLAPEITCYDHIGNIKTKSIEKISNNFLTNYNYILPISYGSQTIKILNKLTYNLNTWKDYEKNGLIWAGREIDETRSSQWLKENALGPKFIKGKMINRYQIIEKPSLRIDKPKWKAPESIQYNRIAWRDVSRLNQKRRVIASIIPKNVVAGNSLGVIYFKKDNSKFLNKFLGIFNSLCFEFQLRSFLATSHVSLSSLREVRIPSMKKLKESSLLENAVNYAKKGNTLVELLIEAIVAKEFYTLASNELECILNQFPKISSEEKELIMKFYYLLEKYKTPTIDMLIRKVNKKMNFNDNKKLLIPNHFASKLSELDMQIILNVPPGGNWKNIPEDIPSNRVKQIRQSYKEGKGSRSTYYGRLDPKKPSYTINTYFNRPGNGCHIHYNQNRTLSQREAARLQSFPDCFTFFGSKTAINNQIGNAVPPLLSFQIAQQLGPSGIFIDLFSGAGGLGYGFKMAGWKPALANDIDKYALTTYANNVHNNVVLGSITDDKIFNILVEKVIRIQKENNNIPLWVLGGPPCQGFSTAGKSRSMNDERNHLFKYYKKFLEQISPDGFIFENVAGLLSMDKGKVFNTVKSEFKAVMPSLTGWVVKSEEHAIPQKRKRVFLIGNKNKDFVIAPLNQITSSFANNYISVHDAISDLPPLSHNEDASNLNYLCSSQNIYQSLMRNEITPNEYLEKFKLSEDFEEI